MEMYILILLFFSTIQISGAEQTENWQIGKTLQQCNMYMLENNISDVSFKITYEKESEPVYQQALKSLLAARSPVFHAMFWEQITEDNYTIEVPDISASVFYDFLRYIYTDEVKLTPDNFVGLSYAANKYKISTLSDKCIPFVREQLHVEGSVKVLHDSVAINDEILKKAALEMIQLGREKAFSSTSNISRESLEVILQSDIFTTSELTIYNACLDWAKERCYENNLEINGKNLRDILGDLLYLIRFAAMKPDDFEREVLPLDLLNISEVCDLYKYFHSPSKPEILPFSSESRDYTVPHTLRFPCTDTVDDLMEETVTYTMQLEVPIRITTITVHYRICKIIIKQQFRTMLEQTRNRHHQRQNNYSFSTGVELNKGTAEVKIEILKERYNPYGWHYENNNNNIKVSSTNNVNDSVIDLKLIDGQYNILDSLVYEVIASDD